MKYLGIDFGTKRIGLALSDANGRMAFPSQIVDARRAFNTILEVIMKEGVGAIVVGNSVAQDGSPNPIAKDIDKFCKDIETHTGMFVFRQDESFSSFEAVRHHYAIKPVANPRRSGGELAPHDDSAAAIILQRFLDKQNAATLPESNILGD